jgi:hypothetical protein
VARQEDPQGSRLPYSTETHQACRYSSEFRYYSLRKCINIDPCRMSKQSNITAFCEGCDRNASCFCDLTRRLTATALYLISFRRQRLPSLQVLIGLQYEDRKITVKVDKLIAGTSNHNNMFRRKLCMKRIPHCVILYTRIYGVPAHTGFPRRLTITSRISVLSLALNLIIFETNLSRLACAETQCAQEPRKYEYT